MSKPIIQHLHLSALTPYRTATALQDALAKQFLAHKASPSEKHLPAPTILTFTPPPIYTAGRRETDADYPPSLIETLKAPLKHTSTPAEFEKASRGGLITFHGPGQLVIYPTLSLRQPSSFPSYSNAKPLTPKCYVNLLESVTISLLNNYGLNAFRTTDPGVWVNSRLPPGANAKSDEAKIAALGIHLRRNVTTYGVGLNVSTDMRWFDKITACGIEGKGVTSLAREIGVGFETVDQERQGLEAIAQAWVGEFARQVGGGEVEVRKVQEGEILEQLGFAKFVKKQN